MELSTGHVAAAPQLVAAGVTSLAAVTDVFRLDRMIEGTAGRLWLREVLPDRSTSPEYVVFVHGNTFPAEPAFDLPTPGCSVSEYLARRGLKCCLFDHRGYGRSPAGKGRHGTEERAQDLADVLAYLVERRGAQRFHLVGLSTGCNTIVASLKAHSVVPQSVVFLGPCYVVNRKLKSLIRKIILLRHWRQLFGRADDEFVRFSVTSLRRRLKVRQRNFNTEAVDQFLFRAMNAADPGRAYLTSPVLGFTEQGQRYRMNQLLFDASCIVAPLVLIRGEHDEFCCEKVAKSLLQNVRGERSIETIAGADHDLHLFQNGPKYFDLIWNFLRTHSEANS